MGQAHLGWAIAGVPDLISLDVRFSRGSLLQFTSDKDGERLGMLVARSVSGKLTFFTFVEEGDGLV